jgi:hypothetical protein
MTMNLDSDAAMRRLIELQNPTHGRHTPTPWHAVGDHAIGKNDQELAVFCRGADRDLALYFTNVHPGTISMLRNFAGAFAFLAADSTLGEAQRHFARTQAETAVMYADLFCRLGRPPQ